MELQEELMTIRHLSRTALRIVLTLSPQMVALAQVRTLKSTPLNVCHVCESCIAFMNRVSGSSLEAPISGI